MSKTTHFGFQEVPEQEKAVKVRAVFRSVAPSYDIMNDLMSGGLHRVWKHFAIELASVRPGEKVLDVASGSGDLALAFARKAGAEGEVWQTDINAAMLGLGRDRLVNAGHLLPAAQCDAEKLPFPDNRFDAVCIAFGLRNVTRKENALAEMRRVIKPGGCAVVLEFSRIAEPLQAAYDWYSFNVLPTMGRTIAGDAESYRYLAESIRMHPDQEALKSMMNAAGLDDVEYHNLSGGVVAVHRGRKY